MSASPYLRLAAASLLAAALPPGVSPPAAFAQAPPAVAERGDPVPLGNGTIYVGTYERAITIVDEATGQVTGQIPLRIGIPRSMVLSPDSKRFYVLSNSLETMEVVDIASREGLDMFTLSSGNEKVRIWGYNVEPGERYAVFLTKSYRRLPDRYEVSAPTLVRYDLKEHRVTDTIPWPRGEERDRAQILFSPDGQFLYFFSDDILVYETKNFTEVDRWSYAQALDAGMGRFDFGFPSQTYEEPGFYTGLFRFTDPVHDRRMMGVARVDLTKRDVSFFAVGPDENVSFVLAPGGDLGYGIQNEVANYQFWTFDLENHRVGERERFAGRSRMSLGISSNGRVLYVYNAGNTIDLYAADDYRYLRTIDLGADNTTPLFVIPGGAGAPSSRSTR